MLGKELTELRNRYKVSKVGLAREVGVPRALVAQWERFNEPVPSEYLDSIKLFFVRGAGTKVFCQCGNEAVRVTGITIVTMDGQPTDECMVLCDSCYALEMKQRGRSRL